MNHPLEMSSAWLRALLGDDLPTSLTLEPEKMELQFPKSTVCTWNPVDNCGLRWDEDTTLADDLAELGVPGSIRELVLHDVILTPSQSSALRHLIERNPVKALEWSDTVFDISEDALVDNHELASAQSLAGVLSLGKPTRELKLINSIRSDAGVEVIAKAVAASRLWVVDIECRNAAMLIALVSANRTIRQLTARGFDFSLLDVYCTGALRRAVTNNWTLETILTFHSGNPHERAARAAFMSWVHETIRGRSCCDVHARTLDYALALLPLRLPVYEMLALVDWLPPMSIRYVWRGDTAFDPHRLRKVQLIEALAAAYRAAMARAQ